MQNNLNQFFTESTIVPHNNDEANKESMNNSFHENSWHECYYG